MRLFLCFLVLCLVEVKTQNVVEVAEQVGLNTFVDYLRQFGLDSEWDEEGALNLFGPTDGAFDAAQNAGLLPEDDEALRELLVYHAVSGTSVGLLTTDRFQDDVLVESTYPQHYVRTNVYSNPTGTIYSTCGSKLDLGNANNNASNGVVQVIEKVMIPTDFSIFDVLSNGNFSQLSAALVATSLNTVLQGPGNFTLFAPTDAAFAKVPPETLQSLLNDTEALTDVLLYHAVGRTFYSEGLYDGLVLTTLQGDNIAFSVQIDGAPGLYINGDARVIYTDVLATNGVMHVINNVLIPSGAETPVGTFFLWVLAALIATLSSQDVMMSL